MENNYTYKSWLYHNSELAEIINKKELRLQELASKNPNAPFIKEMDYEINFLIDYYKNTKSFMESILTELEKANAHARAFAISYDMQSDFLRSECSKNPEMTLSYVKDIINQLKASNEVLEGRK
jgi:hypothetical protein